MIADYFRELREANTQLGSDSWVKFDRKDKSKAWLFPHRLPGVGQGFVKETNEWRITVEVLPIMH